LVLEKAGVVFWKWRSLLHPTADGPVIQAASPARFGKRSEPTLEPVIGLIAEVRQGFGNSCCAVWLF